MVRGVQVIILNNENQLLIAKRALLRKNGTNRLGGGSWNLIGGKIDPGEDILQSAFRESFEEAGVILRDLTFISEKVNFWVSGKGFYSYLFVAHIDNQEVILNPEHSEYTFIKFSDINKYDLLGFTQEEIIQAYELFK